MSITSSPARSPESGTRPWMTRTISPSSFSIAAGGRDRGAESSCIRKRTHRIAAAELSGRRFEVVDSGYAIDRDASNHDAFELAGEAGSE